VGRLRRALNVFLISGLKTTIPFYRAICEEPDFRAGRFDTSYIAAHPQVFNYPEPVPEVKSLEKFIADIHPTVFFPYIY
jgi:pyruvate carboxylase